MASRVEVASLLVALEPGSGEPLHAQLYRGLREAILSGRLAAGTRIPSTRRLAADLGVSRTTVLAAFDQLVAEGYVVGAAGAGSFVASRLPDDLLRSAGAPPPAAGLPRGEARVSKLVDRLRAIPVGVHRDPAPRPFRLGAVEVDAFPLRTWARLGARRFRALGPAELQHGSPMGFGPLREAIAAHLVTARGLRCEAGQVIVVSSSQEALELGARVLLDPGDVVRVEEPGYHGARGAFLAAGATLVPGPVDGEGLLPDEGGPAARLVYVTPSHQHPTGVTLSLARRLALLQSAGRHGAWILEDDYDSEFRYAGRPLTALQGLDRDGRVLYAGTFSKTLFPGLRLGFLVVPPALLDAFAAVRRVGEQHAPTVNQAILTDFMVEGHYARHVRRVRELYRERRDATVEAAARYAAGLLELGPSDTGLHLVAWLPPRIADTAASAAAARVGVEALALSRHYIGPAPRGGLVLGFAGARPHQINAAMRRLADALRTLPGAGDG